MTAFSVTITITCRNCGETKDIDPKQANATEKAKAFVERHAECPPLEWTAIIPD